MTTPGSLLSSFVLAWTIAWPSDAGPLAFVDAAEAGASAASTEAHTVTTTGTTRTTATARASARAASTTTVVDAMAASMAAEAEGWRTEGVAAALYANDDAGVPIAVEIVVRDETGSTLMSLSREVADGEAIEFADAFETPTGERGVRGTVIPRILFGEIVELDFELDATEAEFVDLNWGTYWLHRVDLGPRPPVGEHGLTASRADIVQVAGPGHRARLQTREGPLQIVMVAHPVRG